MKGLPDLRSTALEYNRASCPGNRSKSLDLDDPMHSSTAYPNLSNLEAGGEVDVDREEYGQEGDQTEVTPEEAAVAMRLCFMEWHEVSLSPFTNPFTGDPCVLLSQSDATGRAETEAVLTRLNEVRGL